MRKLFWIFGLATGFYTGLFAQSRSRWVDMFSYRNVLHVDAHGDRIFGGAENAVFVAGEGNNEWVFQKFSTIQGLSGEKLTALHYMDNAEKLLVAHADGMLEILDLREDKILKDNGLKDARIPESQKKINAVADDQGIFYLAMPYGITEYTTDPVGFGNTYRLGPSGTDIAVSDVCIFDNKIFAATRGEGVKYIERDDPYKSDPSRWSSVGTETWTHLFSLGNFLYGIKNGKIYKVYPGYTQLITSLGATPLAVSTNNDYVFLAFGNEIRVLDRQFSPVRTLNAASGYPYRWNDVTCTDDALLAATREHGVVKIDLASFAAEEIFPEGPLYNKPFAADAYNGLLWVVYGDYSQLYNPYPLDRYGISRYFDGHWHNIPYEKIQKVSLTDVKIDRTDTTRVFVGSFHDGLLEFRHGDLVQVYDSTNSTIAPVVDRHGNHLGEYRVSPLEFDRDHRLWIFEGLTLDAVQRFDPATGDWQAYSFEALMQTPFNEGAADMHFDRDGHLWIATHRLGLVGLDPATGDLVALNERNNIPYEGTYRNTQAAAVDKDNVLWIGTLRGLRILRDPSRAFTDPGVMAEPVIIELAELHGQDNQGVELMYGQEITEIVVDGANNKWIGTTNAGVFYFSPDGQKTIYHFTTANSPLPGNAIFDIAVDPVTGIVYISTDKGLIGFKGDATEGKTDLSNAYVYPNPLNQKRHDHLIIRNLMSDISVKITDIEGNLVYETVSRGGTVEWDLRNFAGRKVATGVYLILLTDRDHENTKVLKALIVR